MSLTPKSLGKDIDDLVGVLEDIGLNEKMNEGSEEKCTVRTATTSTSK
jgi:hypothetical protein